MFYVHNFWTIYDIFLCHFFYNNRLKWLLFFFSYALINHKCVCKLEKKIYFTFIFWERKKKKGWKTYNTMKQTAVYLNEDMGNMDHNACTKCTNQLVFSISIKLNNWSRSITTSMSCENPNNLNLLENNTHP